MNLNLNLYLTLSLCQHTRYGYSHDDQRCIFSLNDNINQPISIEGDFGMSDLEFWKMDMDEEMKSY